MFPWLVDDLMVDVGLKSRALTGLRLPVRGLRLLSQAECMDVANAAGHKFIGRTREAAEFPGCVRWGGGFVEFNRHDDESVGCHVAGNAGGAPPACICGGPK